MAEKRAQRRLAAILAADVVGYSRLMEQDEAGTLSTLKARRQDVLVPVVVQHNGRVVKVMGDGVLVEFSSAVDAVQCAVELQKGFAGANEGVAETSRIVLRIGVNLGDIIVEESDIYGDGVNVAARLEGLAEPGGIYVSASVQEQVIGKIELSFEDLGERTLKNIQKPVRIYRARQQAQITAEPAARGSNVRASIAILPFTNLGDDPAQGYFSDGITEDIITELSRWRLLAVQSRSASFRYRGIAVDMKQVARELNVRYIVEGSVRRMGERVRITAQLIDTETGNHVWAEKFDREVADIFVVQDQVVRTIVSTLVGRVTDASVNHAKLKPPGSLAAYELVLRANALNWETREAKAEAREMLQAALRLDPAYATAHSLLAALVMRATDHALLTPAELEAAVTHAKTAIELDENDSVCHSILGWVYLTKGAFDLADEHIERAQQLNPNNSYAMINRAGFLTQTGMPDEAIGWIGKIQRFDPYFNPSWCRIELGLAHFTARRYAEAVDQLSRAPKRPFYTYAFEAACESRLSRDVAARTTLARALELRPDCTVKTITLLRPYLCAKDREHLVQSLIMAGLPE